VGIATAVQFEASLKTLQDEHEKAFILNVMIPETGEEKR